MTELIKQARELCEGATPRTWTMSVDGTDIRVCHTIDEKCVCCLALMGDYNEDETPTEETLLQWQADAAFIAASRTLVPALADALEKAERERDELKALCRPVCPKCGLENDRHFQGFHCDRCGARLSGFKGGKAE